MTKIITDSPAGRAARANGVVPGAKRPPTVCACGEIASVVLTRGYVAIIDPSDVPRVSEWSWRAGPAVKAGRAYVRTVAKIGGRTVQLGRYLLTAGVRVVSHIDGNELDFRRHNLRVRTGAEVARSRQRRRGSRWPYKGVEHDPRNTHRPWRARIRHAFLGNFPTIEEAARAYDDAARRLYGDHAKPNFPE